MTAFDNSKMIVLAGGVRTTSTGVTPAEFAAQVDALEAAASGESTARAQADTSILTEVRDGRLWAPSGSYQSPSGLAPPTSTDMIITKNTITNTTRIWYIQNTAPADGLETSTLVKDATGVWWRILRDGTDAGPGVITVPTVVSAGKDATTGVWSLTGTLGSLADVQGLNVATSGTIISFTAPVSTDGAVTLTIGTDNAPMLGPGGGAMSALFGLLASRSYLFIRFGNQWRYLAGGFSAADLTSLNDYVNIVDRRPAGTLQETAFNSMNPTDGVRLWSADSEGAGNTVANTQFSTSDYVEVKAGESYCLYLPPRVWTGNYNFVAYYTADKTPRGSLIFGNATSAADNKTAMRLLGLQNDPERATFKYFRVKYDGYIRVSTHVSDRAKTYLWRISKADYIASRQINVSEEMLEKLDRMDVLYSVVYSSLGMGYPGTTYPATVAAQRAMSDYIPVKAGQRVHAFSNVCSITSGQSLNVIVMCDMAKAETALSSGWGGHSGRAMNAVGIGGIYAVQNYIATADGYVRLLSCHGLSELNDAGMIFVTDDWLDYDYNWSSEGDVAMRFSGVTAGGSGSGINYAVNALYDTLGPIFIKDGQVAKITTKLAGTNADMAYAHVDSALNSDNNLRARAIPFMQLFDSAVLPSDYESVRYVCAAEAPHIIYARTAAGTGSVEIISQEQALKERNAALKTMTAVKNVTAGVAWPAGTPTIIVTDWAWGFIPVFPGEVLKINTPTMSYRGSAFVYRDQDANGETGEAVDGRDDLWVTLPSIVHGAMNVVPGDGSKPVQYLRPKAGRAEYYGGAISATHDPFTVMGGGSVYPVIITDAEYKALANISDGYIVDRIVALDAAGSASGAAVMGAVTSGSNTTALGDAIRMGMPIFLRKGECIEWRMNCDSTPWRRCPVVFWRDEGSNKWSQMVLDGNTYPTVIPQPQIGHFKAERNCVFYVYERRVGSAETAGTQYTRMYDKHHQRAVRFISEEEYNKKRFAQFEGTLLQIPDPRGLELKFTNGFMPFDVDVSKYNTSIMEIWRNGNFITSVLTRSEVQGQASASLWKKNIDLKAYNKAGKRVSFKIGDWKQTNKLVLKANMNDRTQSRDSMAAEIWRQVRRSRTYPDNNIWDPRLVNQVSTFPDAAFMQDAVCSTQGASVSVFYGDLFYGIYQLRTKKDETNYAVDISGASPHIWLQSDYMMFDGERNVVDWTAFSWKAWEVTGPENDDYEPGYAYPDETVAGNITRFFNWVSACIAGTESFATTYEDYLYLPSWLDYIVTAETIRHWDSARNNLILTTHDGLHWSVHIYDMDQTFGSSGSSPSLAPVYNTSSWADAGMFKLIYDNLRPQINARYAAVRKTVLTPDNLTKMFRAELNTLPHEYRMLDIDIWGTNSGNNVNQVLNWVNSRFPTMDAYYSYTGA